ncbi:MAG TPA: hypothetical protein VK694_06715 [Verrucomicrobiae bacterium]|nr:hypothetical protein [Verrucomicrobiae bacterium]
MDAFEAQFDTPDETLRKLDDQTLTVLARTACLEDTAAYLEDEAVQLLADVRAANERHGLSPSD